MRALRGRVQKFVRSRMKTYPRMTLRPGSILDRAAKYALNSKRTRSAPQASFITKRTRLVSKACGKQITKNLNNYKNTLMKTKGFFIYRGILALTNASTQLASADYECGLGPQLQTDTQYYNKDAAISTNVNLVGEMTDVKFMIFQPQWPGEYLGYFPTVPMRGVTYATFGALGTSASTANDNFPATFSPCVNATMFQSTAQCEKNFASQSSFKKVYIYNSTVKYELQNTNSIAVDVFILDVKFNSKSISTGSATTIFNGKTAYGQITHATSASMPNHDIMLNNYLKAGKLPQKICKVIRKKKVTLGPAFISANDINYGAGTRNTLPNKTVYMKYNNLKTFNRTVASNQTLNEGLQDFCLDENPEKDLYTIIYFVPKNHILHTTDDTQVNKVAAKITKTVKYGIQNQST